MSDHVTREVKKDRRQVELEGCTVNQKQSATGSARDGPETFHSNKHRIVNREMRESQRVRETSPQAQRAAQ